MRWNALGVTQSSEGGIEILWKHRKCKGPIQVDGKEYDVLKCKASSIRDLEKYDRKKANSND